MEDTWQMTFIISLYMCARVLPPRIFTTLQQYITTRVHQFTVADYQGGLEAVVYHKACLAAATYALEIDTTLTVITGKVTSSCYAYKMDRPLFT